MSEWEGVEFLRTTAPVKAFLSVMFLERCFSACRHSGRWRGDGKGGGRERRAGAGSFRGQQCKGAAAPPCSKSPPFVYVCVWPPALCASLCPDTKAHWSPLYPHLCRALQVPPAGAERPGTSVSKNDSFCNQMWVCRSAFFNHSTAVCTVLWL